MSSKHTCPYCGGRKKSTEHDESGGKVKNEWCTSCDFELDIYYWDGDITDATERVDEEYFAVVTSDGKVRGGDAHTEHNLMKVAEYAVQQDAVVYVIPGPITLNLYGDEQEYLYVDMDERELASVAEFVFEG